MTKEIFEPIDGAVLDINLSTKAPAPVHTTTLPQSFAEYMERFKNAYSVSGSGLETTIHSPCPFCACPSWLSYKLLAVQESLFKGATCRDCGRTARMLYDVPNGGTQVELVQTGGSDPPDWLPHPLRRATEGEMLILNPDDLD